MEFIICGIDPQDGVSVSEHDLAGAIVLWCSPVEDLTGLFIGPAALVKFTQDYIFAGCDVDHVIELVSGKDLAICDQRLFTVRICLCCCLRCFLCCCLRSFLFFRFFVTGIDKSQVWLIGFSLHIPEQRIVYTEVIHFRFRRFDGIYKLIRFRHLPGTALYGFFTAAFYQILYGAVCTERQDVLSLCI